MRAGNYPEYIDTKVTCACGNTFTVKSNKEELHLEVCNKCHPTFVGKADANAVSRAGRVEKFMKKYGLDKEAK